MFTLMLILFGFNPCPAGERPRLEVNGYFISGYSCVAQPDYGPVVGGGGGR